MLERGLRFLSKSSYVRRKRKYNFSKTPLIKKPYSTENHDPQDMKLSASETGSINNKVNRKVVIEATLASQLGSNIEKYAIPLSKVEEEYEKHLNGLPEEEKELRKVVGKWEAKKPPAEERFLVKQSKNNSFNNLGGIKLTSETNSSDYIAFAKERIRSQLYKTKEDLGKRYKGVEEIIANIPFKNECKEFYGKALALIDNELHPIDENRIHDINVFISLGVDTGDDVRTIIRGVQGFNELLFKAVKPKKLEKFNIYEGIIWPNPDRVERYKRGLLYYYEEKYVDRYALEFVDKYLILPRILGKDGQEGYMPPEQFGPILFLGYSLGARDNAIYVNAFKQRLVDMLGLAPYEVDAYMRRIVRVNIGATVSWDLPSIPCNSYSINILSLNDMGVLKSQEFFNAIFYNSQIAQQPYTVFHREPSLKRSAIGKKLDKPSHEQPREFLVTLGIDQISGEYQDSSGKVHLNPLGHSPIHYFQGIKNSPAHKLLKPFELYFKYMLEYRDQLPVNVLIDHLLKESKSYALLDKNPSSEEITWREKHLATYIEKQDKLKKTVSHSISSPPRKKNKFNTFCSFFKNVAFPLDAKAKDELANNDPQQKLSK